MKREFTTSVYIMDRQKVLLIYHRKLQKWLPPGGHIESDETPPEAARREVLEEVGLEIEFLTQENVWVKYWNAQSFERPYLCLLAEVPAYQDHLAHQHMDLVYVARPLSAIENFQPEQPMQWFSLEELKEFVLDQEIFAETLQVIEHLFNRYR